MYVGKIEAAEEVQSMLPEHQPKPESNGPGRAILGVCFLIVALPYWGLRLLVETLWLDVRRAGRAVRAASETYGEELGRR